MFAQWKRTAASHANYSVQCSHNSFSWIRSIQDFLCMCFAVEEFLLAIFGKFPIRIHWLIWQAAESSIDLVMWDLVHTYRGSTFAQGYLFDFKKFFWNWAGRQIVQLILIGKNLDYLKFAVCIRENLAIFNTKYNNMDVKWRLHMLLAVDCFYSSNGCFSGSPNTTKSSSKILIFFINFSSQSKDDHWLPL